MLKNILLALMLKALNVGTNKFMSKDSLYNVGSGGELFI